MVGAAAVREGCSTALQLACEGWPGQGQQRQARLRAEGNLQCSCVPAAPAQQPVGQLPAVGLQQSADNFCTFLQAHMTVLKHLTCLIP